MHATRFRRWWLWPLGLIAFLGFVIGVHWWFTPAPRVVARIVCTDAGGNDSPCTASEAGMLLRLPGDLYSLRDWADGREHWRIKLPPIFREDDYPDKRLSPNGRYCAVKVKANGIDHIFIWDRGRLLGEVRFVAMPEFITCLWMLDNGDCWYDRQRGDDRNEVGIIRNGKVVARHLRPLDTWDGLDVSPDGRLLAVQSHNRMPTTVFRTAQQGDRVRLTKVATPTAEIWTQEYRRSLLADGSLAAMNGWFTPTGHCREVFSGGAVVSVVAPGRRAIAHYPPGTNRSVHIHRVGATDSWTLRLAERERLASALSADGRVIMTVKDPARAPSFVPDNLQYLFAGRMQFRIYERPGRLRAAIPRDSVLTIGGSRYMCNGRPALSPDGRRYCIPARSNRTNENVCLLLGW